MTAVPKRRSAAGAERAPAAAPEPQRAIPHTETPVRVEAMDVAALRRWSSQLETFGRFSRTKTIDALAQMGYPADERTLDRVYTDVMRTLDERLRAAEAVPAAREAIEREIFTSYLTDREQRDIAEGRAEPVPAEARRLGEWLRDLDVERAHLEPAYLDAMFGREPGFARYDPVRDGPQRRTALIGLVIAEKAARLRRLQEDARVLGIGRDAAGGLRLRGPDRPQDDGVSIHPIVAHALMNGYAHAQWITDPATRAEAVGRVIRDSYRILGREPELAIGAEDIIETRPAAPEAAAVAAPADTAYPSAGPEMRDAFAAWQREQGFPGVAFPPASSEMAGAFAAWQAGAGSEARAAAAPEITFEEPEIVERATSVSPAAAERGPAIPAAAVAEAQQAYEATRTVAPTKTKWGWVMERAKGFLTAGATEFRHFFAYGRAARLEAGAIAAAYEQLRAHDVGITRDQLEGRMEKIVDDAEERVMRRLIGYKDVYGDMVLDPERLDRFRAELRERLRERYDAQERVDRKELRNAFLTNFDPYWTRRAKWGLIELGLASSGVKLLVHQWLSNPMAVPGAHAAAGPQSHVTFGGPEHLTHALPTPDVTPMTRTIWETLRHAYPGANDGQLVEAAKEVLRQNHLYDPAWTDTVKHIERIGDAAARSTTSLAEGTPITGVFSIAVQKIMGIAAGAAGV